MRNARRRLGVEVEHVLRLRPVTAMHRRKTRLAMRCLALVLAAACSACTENSPEEQRRSVNAGLAPEAEIAADQTTIVRWPRLVSPDGEVMTEPVALGIPPRFRPDPRREWPLTSTPRIESVSVSIVIENMTPWDTLPPIHPEVYDGPRLYSMLKVLFGGKPDSMDDPEIRKDFELWRQRQRTNKLVSISRNSSFASATRRSTYPHIANTLHDSVKSSNESESGFLSDGEVGGLRRYSRLVCVPAAQRNEPASKQMLDGKLEDDPSPAGCVVDRDIALYLSPVHSGSDDWVFIECRSYGMCTARFEAARREAQVQMWAADVERWTETIEPLRKTINAFVLPPGADTDTHTPGLKKKPGTGRALPGGLEAPCQGLSPCADRR
jgi:hypothetical protein